MCGGAAVVLRAVLVVVGQRWPWPAGELSSWGSEERGNPPAHARASTSTSARRRAAMRKPVRDGFPMKI